MKALTPNKPPKRGGFKIARPPEEEPTGEAKPRWARNATTKTGFTPELLKQGTRLEHKVQRCQRWAQN